MLDSLTYLIERFFIRSFRIALGAVVLFIAYLFALEAYEIATKTLTSITLAELFAFLFLSIFAFCLFYLAFVIAFGEGPSEWERNKEKEERLRVEVEEAGVEVEEARAEAEEARADAEEARADAEENARLSDAQQDRRTWIKKQSMKAGRVVGRLFKKTRN